MMNFRNISKLNVRSPSRLVSSSAARLEKVSSTADRPPNPAEPVTNSVESRRVSDFDKKILVWTKKYKTIEEIPEKLSHQTLDRARNKFRIKVCNWMLVATLAGCGLMIYSGKQAEARGETVQRMNLEWHKKLNEDAAVAHGENK